MENRTKKDLRKDAKFWMEKANEWINSKEITKEELYLLNNHLCMIQSYIQEKNK